MKEEYQNESKNAILIFRRERTREKDKGPKVLYLLNYYLFFDMILLFKRVRMSKTLVMKFGGASVASVENFSHIADIVIAHHKIYQRLIIVVSAMGETTNQLIELAYKVNPEPPQREYDMLISAGERISMSLLAMALCRKNTSAVSFTGSQSGIITCNKHTNAQIIEVKPYRLEECLKKEKIVIVAGFQGVSQEREITTLGRGGSDTTAVALAAALQADKVEFYKDVPGVFNVDPKHSSEAFQFKSINYSQAFDIVKHGARILHPRAIQLAEKNGIPLHVRSFKDFENEGTIIEDLTISRSALPLFE